MARQWRLPQPWRLPPLLRPSGVRCAGTTATNEAHYVRDPAGALLPRGLTIVAPSMDVAPSHAIPDDTQLGGSSNSSRCSSNHQKFQLRLARSRETQ